MTMNQRFDVVDEAAVRQMVELFYQEVQLDAVLGPVFGAKLDGRWPVHLERMVDFWNSILLGTKSFQGNVYGKHMALSGIVPEHFVRWLALFRQTVTTLFNDAAAAEILTVADRIAGSLQLGFFGERSARI
jgi:hemoglobin